MSQQPNPNPNPETSTSIETLLTKKSKTGAGLTPPEEEKLPPIPPPEAPQPEYSFQDIDGVGRAFKDKAGRIAMNPHTYITNDPITDNDFKAYISANQPIQQPPVAPPAGPPQGPPAGGLEGKVQPPVAPPVARQEEVVLRPNYAELSYTSITIDHAGMKVTGKRAKLTGGMVIVQYGDREEYFKLVKKRTIRANLWRAYDANGDVLYDADKETVKLLDKFANAPALEQVIAQPAPAPAAPAAPQAPVQSQSASVQQYQQPASIEQNFANLCLSWYSAPIGSPEQANYALDLVKFYQANQNAIKPGFRGLSLEGLFVKYLPQCKGIRSQVSPIDLRKKVMSLLEAYKR